MVDIVKDMVLATWMRYTFVMVSMVVVHSRRVATPYLVLAVSMSKDWECLGV
jgi:hypothetical protein